MYDCCERFLPIRQSCTQHKMIEMHPIHKYINPSAYSSPEGRDPLRTSEQYRKRRKCHNRPCRRTGEMARKELTGGGDKWGEKGRMWRQFIMTKIRVNSAAKIPSLSLRPSRPHRNLWKAWLILCPPFSLFMNWDT